MNRRSPVWDDDESPYDEKCGRMTIFAETALNIVRRLEYERRYLYTTALEELRRSYGNEDPNRLTAAICWARDYYLEQERSKR